MLTKENHQYREELAALDILPESVRQMIRSGDYLTTIADIGGYRVGFSMAQISAKYVFATFVRPEYEARGVGRSVLEAAERGLAEHGVDEARLSTGADDLLRAVGSGSIVIWAGLNPVYSKMDSPALSKNCATANGNILA